MMKTIFSKRRNLFQAAGIVLIVLVIALYIGMPTVMAVAAVMPDQGVTGEAPEGFAQVSLTTDDGIRLGAWYAEPENGAVIILVHGAGGGRDGVRSYATMLQKNGYGVLAVNMRGFGDSEGRINRLGWQGTHDVGAAIRYLEGRDNVQVIGGLGLSMGGEILLGAAASYPALHAIAADGATHRCAAEYTALPMNQPLYRNFTYSVFSFMVGVFTGDTQPQPPLLDSIEQAETTHFLFIAAGQDENEVTFNQFYHDALSNRSSLWVIPEAGHIAGFSHDPEAYEQHLISFFEATLIR